MPLLPFFAVILSTCKIVVDTLTNVSDTTFMTQYIVRFQMNNEVARRNGLKAINSKKEFKKEPAAKKFAQEMQIAEYTVSLHSYDSVNYMGETVVVF